MELSELAIALVALTAMEIVLGIDNIVFIAIISGRLPPEQQPKARKLGLVLALGTRLLLLLSLSFILGLTATLFELSSLGIATEWLHENPEINEVAWRDLILLAGGLFLIAKSVIEIHHKMEGNGHEREVKKAISFKSVLIQIAVLDIVFSLDSIITAVGMVRAEGEGFWLGIGVMATAVVIAIAVMLLSAEKVSRFVEHNPTIKMLALSFLLLIGVMLVAEAVGTPIQKGYIYFAMAFSLLVEFLNLRMHSKRKAKQQAVANEA